MNAPAGGKAATPALADFIVLNEEIAALVRARIPLESNLARIGKQLPGKAGDLAQRVGRRLDAGESLVSAIDAECASMPATYRAVLVAGAESGRLGSALEAVVDSATRSDQLRRVTSVALLYPLAVVILVCLLLALVLKTVVPNFEWLNRSSFKPIEWLAHSPYTVPILAIAIPCSIIVLTLFWWWRSGRLGSAGTPRLGLLATLSGSGRVYRWSEAARFAELLRLLVDRGLPLDKSLQLTAEVTSDRRLRNAAQQFAKDICSGEAKPMARPATSAQAQSGFPVLIRLALHHAGDRSLLAAGLQQASTMYHERAGRAAEWYAEYLPILLTVAIGGTFTIGFTLFVLWPYTRMLYEISGWNWR
ncbi:MAG: type II secretion system F family protein [Planctomycetes bacterium]|nr:type II secretion system F family protein [Planctomycetota bacterium]